MLIPFTQMCEDLLCFVPLSVDGVKEWTGCRAKGLLLLNVINWPYNFTIYCKD